MSTAQAYQRFAEIEARGSSRTYEVLARHVAQSPAMLDLLDTLPPLKRQPNLLFGVGRFLGGPVADPAGFTAWAAARWPEVSAEILSRSTQTNEAARCASLLPVLAGIPGPLALLEVGASAGLCLYADRYRYDYGGAIVGADGSGVTLACERQNDVPVPAGPPEVVWRSGVDLNPLDLRRDDDLAWLDALVWPEHRERRDRLRAAAQVVRDDPPVLVAADLNDGLRDLAGQAPDGATLVVFHSAVLAYLDEGGRARFAETVRDLPGHWVANEAPRVLEGLVTPPPRPAPRPGQFLLALDGVPKAWTDPHGRSLFWLDQ